MPVAAVAMIVPVWVAVLRVGLRHLVPVGDTAIMALRAPDVLSRHPPLIGMPASSASSAAQVVHFPGAWQLYWLAVPVKVLGATWGTVVAMGALNTIWILLAAWLIRRLLSPTATLVAYVVLAVFWWSLGSGMLIDSWPLLMVVVPFATVLVAAWAAACGDAPGLVVLAFAANYVWLDHLVLGLLAPLVAAAGCVGFVLWFFRARHADSDDPAGAQRRFRRGVLGAATVTVVMWLPPVIQQITHTPGNFGLLFGRSDGAPAAIASPTAAVHVLASLIGRPPFWLRGTLADPTFYRADPTGNVTGSMTWADLGIVVVVAMVLAGCAISAWQRRDRVAGRALLVAAVGIVGAAATVYAAPVTTSVVPQYLFGVWAVAMFTWLAIVVNVTRAVTARWTARRTPRSVVAVGSSDAPAVTPSGVRAASTVAWAAFGLVIVFCAANLPASASGYTANPQDTAVAKAMIRAIVPKVKGHGPVGLTMANVWTGNANTLSALQLGLVEHGVGFCYPTPNTSLYEFIDDCDGTESSVLVLDDGPADAPPAGEVWFRRVIYPGESHDATEPIDRDVRTWLGGLDRLTLTTGAQRPFLGSTIPNMLRSRVAGFAPRDGDLSYLADSEDLWDTVIIFHDRSGNRGDALFVGQPVDNATLYRWAQQRRQAVATQWVTRRADR